MLFFYNKYYKEVNIIESKKLLRHLLLSSFLLILSNVINGSNFLNQKPAVIIRNLTGSMAVACNKYYSY